MKNGLVTVIITCFLSTVAYGRFVDSSTEGKQTSNGWSWAAVKTAVVEKVTSWFAPKENESDAAKGDRMVASETKDGNLAAPVKKVKEDSWNPFSKLFSSATKPDGTKTAPTASQGISSPGSIIEPTVSLRGIAPQINNIKVARTAQSAVPFKDKNLVMGHNGIPVFEFKKFKARTQSLHVKKVPLLYPGTEEVLDSKAFEVVNLLPFPTVPYEAPKVLTSPSVTTASEFKEMLGGPVAPIPLPEKIDIPILEPSQKVTAEKIAKLIYSLGQDTVVTPLPVTVIAEEDLKLLRGLILYEKKDQCHVASGIFSDLLVSQREDIGNSAQYHLGVCLHEMNLPTESLYHLGKAMRGKNSQFASDAIKVSLEDVQVQHENEIVEAVQGVDAKLVPESVIPHLEYLKAKYYIRKGHPEKALEFAVKVPSSSPFFYKAQYVASVAEYELGKEDSSIVRQKNISVELAKKGSDKDTLALFEMNLGRVAFQRAKYKESIEAYQKIPRENPLWMQGLMELGWAQLQSKDMAGAIGNMHSIQSPYFDGVYKPESYVVRTIGYVNLCQFPDAFKSLGYLEFKYAPWMSKIEDYNKSHNGDQTYQTVLKMLQTKGNVEIDGVPSQALREVARHRDFLNVQESLNQLIDENSGYSFIKSLIEKDKKSLLVRRNATVNKVAELNNKIKKARTVPDAMKNFNAWRFELANYEDFLAVYEFKVKTLKEGQDGLVRMTPKAQERIAVRRNSFREQAGHILKGNLVKLAKELSKQLENNELLKYEVYAGSGENLRYKMAGGKVGGVGKNSGDRRPAGMKWDFDGEYWADEIGNYRSSLKNNCQNFQLAGQRKGN